ncbi:MAG: HEAT repeat domain-containing protein [Candidatus Omnitrophota bacterium]
MDEKKLSFKEKENPARAKIAGQFAANFLGLLKAISLYPKGHQMLVQVAEKFYIHLEQLLTEFKTLTLQIYANNIYLLDQCIHAEKAPGIEAFMEDLQKRYIRQIVFSQGVSVPDLTTLLDILGADPKDIIERGGAEAMLANASSKNIHIIEYYSRRHIDFKEDDLLAIINSRLFRFFVDDQIKILTYEQTLQLYDFLKNSILMCELLKAAFKFITEEPQAEAAESQTILKILKKINPLMLEAGLSEHAEMKHIVYDIIFSFDKERCFTLASDDPNDSLLEYAGVLPDIPSRIEVGDIADLTAKKLAKNPEDDHVIISIKTFLCKIFISRSAFLAFLPAFKKKLGENIPSEDKAHALLNDICSAFGAGFAVDDDVVLALGTVTSTDNEAIVTGLNLLRTVHLDIQEVTQQVENFDIDTGRLLILTAVISAEDDPALLEIFLRTLIDLLTDSIKTDNPSRNSLIVEFLAQQTQKRTAAANKLIINAIKTLPDILLETLIISSLTTLTPDSAVTFLGHLAVLFEKQLTAILIQLYISNDSIPHQDIICKVISDSGILDFDRDLRNEPSKNLTRIVDLLGHIRSYKVLPLLWEVTFHEDIILALRALKILAEHKSHDAFKFIIKALTHPNVQLAMASIDHLALFKTQESAGHLAAIARGRELTGNPEMALTMRLMAIRSLSQIDHEQTKQVLRSILKNRRFLIIPIEPKKLRLFAAEQLKNMN